MYNVGKSQIAGEENCAVKACTLNSFRNYFLDIKNIIKYFSRLKYIEMLENGNIYCIKNSINNLTYIGSTKQSLIARFEQHKRDMHKHLNIKLYKAMNEFN
jgi:hypothetical protein